MNSRDIYTFLGIVYELPYSDLAFPLIEIPVTRNHVHLECVYVCGITLFLAFWPRWCFWCLLLPKHREVRPFGLSSAYKILYVNNLSPFHLSFYQFLKYIFFSTSRLRPHPRYSVHQLYLMHNTSIFIMYSSAPIFPVNKLSIFLTCIFLSKLGMIDSQDVCSTSVSWRIVDIHRKCL